MEIGGDVIVGGELSVEGDLVVGDDPLDPPDADAPTDGDVSTDEEPVEEDPTEEANSVMRSMALADEASDDPTEEKEVGAFLVSGGKEGEDYETIPASRRGGGPYRRRRFGEGDYRRQLRLPSDPRGGLVRGHLRLRRRRPQVYPHGGGAGGGLRPL